MEKIFVCGAGGHAKVIIDIIRTLNLYEIEAVIETKSGKPFLGIDLIEEDVFLNNFDKANVFIAIGENYSRQKVYEKYARKGFLFPNLIHPTAVVSKSANLGVGNAVMANAVINPGASIGNHCVINTGSIIEHDCQIGDFVSCAPASVTCGECTLGEGVYLGANASIIHSKIVGEWSVIGSQSAVVKDVDAYTLVQGVPAKEIRSLTVSEKVL